MGRTLLVMTCAAALLIPFPAPCQEASRPRVFVLQSYHAELEWTANVTAGIQETFSRSGLDVEIQTDYLDARRYPQKELLSAAAALIEERIRRYRPDLLIAGDNAALTFAVQERDAAFPGIPIVFCGINSFNAGMLGGEKNITGVPENVSIADTVRLALRLHAGVRRIVVVGRTQVAADAVNRSAFMDALPSLGRDVDVEFWDDLPMAELQRRLPELGRDTIVFVNGLTAEEGGRELMYDETTSFIRAHSSVPLYSLWDVYLGHGIVGGRLVSGRKQGELAASIAVRILKGESADSIPIVGAQEANQWMFDQRELRRFRILRSSLPAGSVIVNDSFASLRRYWWVVLIVGLFVVMETAIITILTAAIRQRAAAQEKIRASEERLELALSGADLAIWDWDVIARTTTFNRRGAEMLGFRGNEIGQSVDDWRSLVHPDELTRVSEVMDGHLRGEIPAMELETRLRHNSGRWIWVLYKGRVIERDAKGRAIRACGTLLDITEHKLEEEKRMALERQLLHAQKLESLGLLAGGIAHDFNNLLTAILGNLDLISKDIPESSEAGLCVNAAMKATQKAADLARQMLAYSGKGRFVNRAIDLNAFVRDISELLRTSISKGAFLDLKPGDSPVVVLADSAQLQQVVLNLITNASEAASGNHGAIRITTGSVFCTPEYLAASRLQDAPAGGMYSYLEVSDDGCGMSEETLRRMFEPYFSTKGMGRGLGLSAVLGIVKGHRGAIMVDSLPGSGTTVRVLFPAASAVAEEMESVPEEGESEAMPPLSGLALVVDDEEPIRRLAQMALERIGLRVQTTADSGEALEFFRSHAREIRVVLLDFTLPTMDGAAVFKEMKSINADAKVILSSGYNQQEVTQRLTGSDLAGFVQKPYLVATLVKEVRRVLSAA